MPWFSISLEFGVWAFLFVLSLDSPDLVLARRPLAHTADALSYSWLKKRTAQFMNRIGDAPRDQRGISRCKVAVSSYVPVPRVFCGRRC